MDLDKADKMGHYIQLGIHLTDDLGITKVTIDSNTTNMESDHELVKKTCITLLRSIDLNMDDLIFQNLVKELQIKKSSS